jgi:hypothetical protein
MTTPKVRVTRKRQIPERHYPPDIVADVKRVVKQLDQAMVIMRPIKADEIEELKWQLSLLEDMITLYGNYMYDKGRNERNLFSE